jgi:hypothetical protein
VSPRPPQQRTEQFSIERWLAAQTTRGAENGATPISALAPPQELLANELLRQETLRYSVQLLVAERCSLAATAGLINATATESHKRFLAAQALEEAHHMEIFTYRVLALGVEPAHLETTVDRYAHPDLVALSEVVLRSVQAGDVLGGLLAQGLVLDEIVSATYDLLAVLVAPLEPDFARIIEAIVRDEERHGAFAELVVGELLVRHPDRKVGLDRLQRGMTALMMNTFADTFRDNPLADELRRVLGARNHGTELRWQGIDVLAGIPRQAEAELERVIAARIRARFSRLGIAYHATARP